MDATLITVCLAVFDWAHYRRSKGAIKLHMLFSHQGYLPKWAMVITGKTHEVNVLKTLVFEPHTIQDRNSYSSTMNKQCLIKSTIISEDKEGWKLIRLKASIPHDYEDTRIGIFYITLAMMFILMIMKYVFFETHVRYSINR
jgi:hypothetical protein